MKVRDHSMAGLLFGRACKAEMVAQRLTGVLGTESAAALQDRYDMIDERREFMRQRRSHEREAVDRTSVLPSNDMVGELFRGADEVGRAGTATRRLGDLA
jgi:hypothetical protein